MFNRLVQKLSWTMARHDDEIKWLATMCYIFGTVILISPDVAAKSLTPFVVFFIGNTVWTIDSYVQCNREWFWAGVFFMVYDSILIYSRMTDTKLGWLFDPIIKFINNIFL